jgi:hypothetical protein
MPPKGVEIPGLNVPSGTGERPAAPKTENPTTDLPPAENGAGAVPKPEGIPTEKSEGDSTNSGIPPVETPSPRKRRMERLHGADNPADAPKPETPPAENSADAAPEPESTDDKKPETETSKPGPLQVEVDGESIRLSEFVSRLLKERARVEGTSLSESVKKGDWNKETLAHTGADGAPREWAQLTGWLKTHKEEIPRFVAEYEDLKTKLAPGEDAGVDIGETHLPFSRFEQASFDTARHLDAKNNDFETMSEYEERLRARDKRRFIAYFLAQQSGGSEAVEALRNVEDFTISKEQEEQAINAIQGMDDEEYARIAKQALEAAIPDTEKHSFRFPDHVTSDAEAGEIRDYYWNEFARKIKPESEATIKKRVERWDKIKKKEEKPAGSAAGESEERRAA